MPFNLPRATKGLLIANIAGFVLQWMLGDQRLLTLMLWPWTAAGGAYVDAPHFMQWL